MPEDGGLIDQALIGLKPVNAWVHTYTKPQTSSTRSRGLGWRIHESVEDTKLSTNKQHTLSGGRAIRGAVSTIAQHGTSADNKSTRLGGGRDNGELSDVAQKYCTTQWHGLGGLPQARTVKCEREMMLFIGT